MVIQIFTVFDFNLNYSAKDFPHRSRSILGCSCFACSFALLSHPHHRDNILAVMASYVFGWVDECNVVNFRICLLSLCTPNVMQCSCSHSVHLFIVFATLNMRLLCFIRTMSCIVSQWPLRGGGDKYENSEIYLLYAVHRLR